MQERSFKTVRISEIERDDGWSPLRRHLDVGAFGINAWTAHEAGARIIREHDESPSGHEELYLVAAGHARFRIEGEEVDAPAGTVVHVRDAAATRGAVALEPETTVVAVGARPGAAYRPRAWETNAEVFDLFDRGRPAEAKRLLVEALDRYEDLSGILFNLACAEAQLGEADAALEHLRAAILERPAFAAEALVDDDLAALRDDPRFAEIVGR